MSGSENKLLAAVRHHYQAGELPQAEACCRQVLEQQPQNIEALSWLALVCDRRGDLQESVALYEQVLALRPDLLEPRSNLASVLGRLGQGEAAIAQQQQVVAQAPERADCHYNLGVILAEAGKTEEAIAEYQEVIRLEPKYVNTYNNLGTLLGEQGKLDEAIFYYQQAVALDPNHANAHNNLGVALSNLGKLDEAITHYQRAISLQPDYASAHSNLGTLFEKQKKLEQAAFHHERAAELQPNSATAYNQLGIILQRQGKLEEALVQYQRAIALKPNYASAYDNIGTVLHEQKKLEEAIAQYRKAIELKPDCANAYSNLGTALLDQGKPEEAIASCQEAIRFQPTHADAHNNYGSALLELGRFEEAITYYEQAIHHNPDHASAHLNLGITLLLLGKFQRGWQEYHWRWETPQCPPLRYPNALWDGTSLQGKTILLTAEQGFGDTIQFARYAPLVAQYGGKVMIACQQPLLRLLSSLPGIERCVNRDRVNVETHCHAPVLDLPMILGTTPETIPAQIPYLAPLNTQTITLESFPHTRLKIGFAWAANPKSSTAKKRSCSLEQFLVLLQIPDIALYSLQKEPTQEDLQLLQGQERLQDLREQLSDFADTAAAIAQLDLVISVDTAVIHLAGALGKPVWTLLADIADWRWLCDRSDTAWYPTMRLFRQALGGTWEAVFAQVMTALQAELAQAEPLQQYQLPPSQSDSPNLAQIHLRLGYSFYADNKLEEAIAHYQQTLALQPDCAEAYNNLGVALCKQGQIDAALNCYGEAMRLQPAYADAHLNRAIALLLAGNLQPGFAEYAWRWQTEGHSLPYPQALWDGSDLTGKTIMLTAEQGFGDTIQFIRYVPLVAQVGGRIVVACQKPLMRLFSNLPGIDRCIDRNTEAAEIHVHAPLMELPRILGTTLETIPAAVPYLWAEGDTEASSSLSFPSSLFSPSSLSSHTLPLPTPHSLQIGIVWASRSTSQSARDRSCALSYWSPLLSLPDVTFYSLQKDCSPTEKTQLAEMGIQDLSESLEDFADTAGAIAHLDLVISVDTAVAHLAGAMGKPVWTLLSAAPDWRWLLDREDSPWYPTMRLFRQPTLGDWQGAIEQVKKALANKIQTAGDKVTKTDIQNSSLSSPSPLPQTGFNRLKPCRHGTLLYNHYDIYIGKSLELYGEWSEGEVMVFQPLIQPGDVVVEVGANIGTHTVFFAQAVGSEGTVLAFEPQRVVFQTLCANLALNSLTNTHCYPIALGDVPGFAQIPTLDYSQPNNFGGVSLSNSAGEQVQVVPLDSFAIPRCRLLKIDAEGMELQVLKGAAEMLQHCQPILYLENDRAESSQALIDYLHSLGYQLYWHRPPLYNPENFCSNPHNVFGNTISINMLCIKPIHNIVVTDLEQVKISTEQNSSKAVQS